MSDEYSPDPFAGYEPLEKTSASLPSPRDMRILIVEDFATMRRVIRNLLQDLGYGNICEADDGMDALAQSAGRSGDYRFTNADHGRHGAVACGSSRPPALFNARVDGDRRRQARANH